MRVSAIIVVFTALALAAGADNPWTSELSELVQSDLFAALGANTDSLFGEYGDPPRDIPAINASQLAQLHQYAAQRFPGFFPKHAKRFTRWSLALVNRITKDEDAKGRELLVGLRAAQMLRENLEGARFGLNSLSLLTPAERRLVVRGVVLPERELVLGRARAKAALTATLRPTKRVTLKPTKRATFQPTTTPKPTKRPTLQPTVVDAALANAKTFDLRKYGAVGPIKNQGYCGSCYAFAANAVTEGRLVMGTGAAYTALSEQQVVSCGNVGQCVGGWIGNVWNYAQNGIASSNTYPYTSHNAQVGACRTKALTPKVAKTELELVYVTNEREMKLALLSGPVAIVVPGDNRYFYNYRSGVMDPRCSTDPADLNHSVVVVGWGDGFWIIRNSWGASWGSAGYGKLPFAEFPGACGMFRHAYYTASVSKF